MNKGRGKINDPTDWQRGGVEREGDLLERGKTNMKEGKAIVHTLMHAVNTFTNGDET